MKKIFFLSAIVLPTLLFAQENGNPQVQIQNVNYFNQGEVKEQQSSAKGFGPEDNKDKLTPTTGCKDCDAVHQALKAAHILSGSHHKKSFRMKAWAKIISGRTSLRVKKLFARKYKAKTSYAICFNWH